MFFKKIKEVRECWAEFGKEKKKTTDPAKKKKKLKERCCNVRERRNLSYIRVLFFLSFFSLGNWQGIHPRREGHAPLTDPEKVLVRAQSVEIS